MSDEQLKIITEARDLAMRRAFRQIGGSGDIHGGTVELQFLEIAQKLDEILRPELMAELRKKP